MSTTVTPTKHNHHNTISSLLPSSYTSLNGSIHHNNLSNPIIIHKYADSTKAKRSLDKENTSPECEPFTIGDDSIKTFWSPGYPNDYTKNISCVRVIDGEMSFKYFYFISNFLAVLRIFQKVAWI